MDALGRFVRTARRERRVDIEVDDGTDSGIAGGFVSHTV